MADQPYDIIEFLDTDEGVFDGSDAAAFADPTTNRRAGIDTARPQTRARWVVPAFVALFAVVAASIVVAVVGDAGADRAGGITSPGQSSPVTAPTSTASTLAPLLPIEPPPFLADAPPGFTLTSAARGEPNTNTAPGASEPSMELWATQEAMTTDSDIGLRAWFSVTRQPAYADMPLVVGAYRMLVGDVEVRLTPPTAQRTTTTVEFVLDGQLVRIDSFGWYARPLQKLIAFIADGGTDYSASFVATDHLPVYRGRPRPMIGISTSLWQITQYVDRSGGVERSLRFDVGTATAAWPGATNVALADATDVVLRVSGFDSPGVFGRTVDEPEVNVLQWVVNGWLLTARGDLTRDELVAFAESSYAATQQQYDRFAAAIEPPPLTTAGASTDVEVSTAIVPFATGPTIDGVSYAVELSVMQSSVERTTTVRLSTTNPSLGQWPVATLPLPADQPVIQSIIDGSMTLVVASAPSGSPATHLRVNVTGDPAVSIPLAATMDPADPRLSIYFFTTPAPFTAELVDATGTVIINWPDTAAAG